MCQEQVKAKVCHPTHGIEHTQEQVKAKVCHPTHGIEHTQEQVKAKVCHPGAMQCCQPDAR